MQRLLDKVIYTQTLNSNNTLIILFLSLVGLIQILTYGKLSISRQIQLIVNDLVTGPALWSTIQSQTSTHHSVWLAWVTYPASLKKTRLMLLLTEKTVNKHTRMRQLRLADSSRIPNCWTTRKSVMTNAHHSWTKINR